MCTKSRKKRCKISSIMIYDYYASPPLPLLNPEFFPLFFLKVRTQCTLIDLLVDQF